MTDQTLHFVSTREDGLCMRLNTILDAILLAKATAGRFGFVWIEDDNHPLDQQTTSSLAEVFTPSFTAAHRLTALPPGPVLPPLRSAKALADLAALARPSGLVQVDQPRDLSHFAPALAEQFGAGAYPEAFAALGLTAEIRRAIALAHAQPIGPSAAAIHLRGGDILHGTHAHHDVYLHKAPSVLEVEALILKLTGAGQQVWLIGQEPDVQAAMARRHPGVVLPPSTGLGSVAQVIFDAVLMSRMQVLHGGNSGVTLLSRRLGGRPFHDLAKLPPVADPVRWRDDPLSAPGFAEVSAAMKAHTYAKVITAADPADWTDLHLRLITLARHWRPQSKFLGLVQICVLVHLGQTQAAEAEACALLSAPLDPGLLPQMGYAFLTEAGYYFPLHLTEPLSRRPLAGLPALELLAALRAALTGPQGRAQAKAALAGLGSGAVDPGFAVMIEAFLQQASPA